jgi:hypothetical protein
MGFNAMKHHNPDPNWNLSSNYHAMQSYAEYLIRAAIEEASPYLKGAEIRNIFKEEMERRYGKEA